MAAVVLISAGLSAAVRFRLEVFRVEGSSMAPTLHEGQYIVATKSNQGKRQLPSRGTLVVFQDSPADFFRVCVKRVIGLPGEKVEVRKACIYINDQHLHEPYVVAPGHYGWGPATVPPAQYFVLGDDRRTSYDSSSWGWLSDQRIIGTVRLSGWPPQWH